MPEKHYQYISKELGLRTKRGTMLLDLLVALTAILSGSDTVLGAIHTHKTVLDPEVTVALGALACMVLSWAVARRNGNERGWASMLFAVASLFAVFFVHGPISIVIVLCSQMVMALHWGIRWLGAHALISLGMMVVNLVNDGLSVEEVAVQTFGNALILAFGCGLAALAAEYSCEARIAAEMRDAERRQRNGLDWPDALSMQDNFDSLSAAAEQCVVPNPSLRKQR